MKWTYWLMIVTCVALTLQQVFLSESMLLEGLLPPLPETTAEDQAGATGPGNGATLPYEEIIGMLEPVTATTLGRDPFGTGAHGPVTAIMGTDGMVEVPWPSSPWFTTTEVESAGRFATPTASPRSSANQRPVTLDSRSRISRRLNTNLSLFEETRFGAASSQRAATSRRSANRSARRSGVIRSSR